MVVLRTRCYVLLLLCQTLDTVYIHIKPIYICSNASKTQARNAAQDDDDEYETPWEDAEEAVRWGTDPQGNAVVCNATGALALAAPLDACSPLTAAHSGAVLLAQRGLCTFMTKARHAQRAGAVALVLDNEAGEQGVVSMRGDEGMLL